jgi:hypothetical protein
MPYAAGVFTLVAGNPVVTGTIVSSTWANNTLTDIATGLSTAILKDGTQTTTAKIPFDLGISILSGGVTVTAGGIAVASGGVAITTSGGAGLTLGSGSILTAYIENTWTPIITVGGTVSAIAGTFLGDVTKVGRMVVAQYSLSFTNRGSGTGNVVMTNLPYAANANTVQAGGGGGVANFSGMTSTLIYVSAQVIANTSTANLKTLGAAATSIAQLQGLDLSATSLIQGTLCYAAQT